MLQSIICIVNILRCIIVVRASSGFDSGGSMSLNSLVPRLDSSILANASKVFRIDLASLNKGVLVFCWLVVGCQAATILITWPLWQAHQTPPILPLFPLPSFGIGPLFPLFLGLVLFMPLSVVFSPSLSFV